MKEQLLALLRPHGQDHLLAFWELLARDEQAGLAEQLQRIDWGTLAKLSSGKQATHDWESLAKRAIAPPAFRLRSTANPFTPGQAKQAGTALLQAGKVAALLVAGGQGTRLGFDHPKGMYPIGPISRASLFQILIEKLLARARRHGVQIPLFLMTSPATHQETIDYLHQEQRFGLAADDLHIFCQGTMPAVDAVSGRVLLEGKGQLALSPDGHGGMLAALAASGGLQRMADRGIEQLFYFQVDNPLVCVCDPEFLGYHLLARSEMSTQVVAKRTARDKVGNVVSIDGKVQILEYSDLNRLSDAIVQRCMPDGSPVFWAGNIAVHVLDVAFLLRAARDEAALPFHIARKKVPHLNSRGERVEPPVENALKFERFIFDLLPSASKSIVVEVDEIEVFAPLKNALGEALDTPQTVQAAMLAQHRRWLEQAGAILTEGVAVEICPLFAQDAEETRQKVLPQRRFSESVYLR